MANTIVRFLGDLYNMSARADDTISQSKRADGVGELIEFVFDRIKGLDEYVSEQCREQRRQYDDINKKIAGCEAELTALESQIAYHEQFDTPQHRMDARQRKREYGRLQSDIAAYEAHQAKLLKNMEKDQKMMNRR
jgi:hypothetical protein